MYGVKPLINFFNCFYKVFSEPTTCTLLFYLKFNLLHDHIFSERYIHDSSMFCQNIRPCLKSCSEMPGNGKSTLKIAPSLPRNLVFIGYASNPP